MMGARCAQHSVQGATASDEKAAITEWKSGWVEMPVMDGMGWRKVGPDCDAWGKIGADGKVRPGVRLLPAMPGVAQGPRG